MDEGEAARAIKRFVKRHNNILDILSNAVRPPPPLRFPTRLTWSR